ncbi:MAG: hypothetical protein D6705_11275 [Deltaproteobacteria bacterium]|nr:MAG: hypothetical protein D6705_11275 [Deltaproteobacteria bacterium]
MTRRVHPLLAGVVTFLVSTTLACSPKDGGAPEDAGATFGDGPAVASSSTTRWVPVVPPRDPVLLSFPAIVRAIGKGAAYVTFPYAARVERIHVEPGDRLAAGATILSVRCPAVLEAAATVLGTRKRLALHRRRLEELERAHAEGLVGRDVVFEHRTRIADIEAERARAEAVLRGAGVEPRRTERLLRDGLIELSAPTAGVVTEVSVRPGESISPSSPPLARIVGEAPPRIEVRLPRALPSVHDARFVAPDGRTVGLAKTPLAVTEDPADGLYVAWFAPREDALRLHDGLRGRFEFDVGDGVWQVPAAAVTKGAQASFVVLRRRGGDVSEIPVEVVSAAGASALVRGDLEAADMVAADGRVARIEGSQRNAAGSSTP